MNRAMTIAARGCRIVALMAALSLLASDGFAQTQSGVITGIARGADDGAPLAFSLIRLLPVDTARMRARHAVTDTAGRFRFPDVLPGVYRLQLELVGHQPTLSPLIEVRAGATLSHELRSALEAIRLPAISVRAAGSCLSGDRIDDDAGLAALWRETQKGVEIRRAFELQYRYVHTFLQEGEVKRRLLGPEPLRYERMTVNDPDSVLARDQRRRAEHRARGYGTRDRGGFDLSLPDEKELLDDEFLQHNCFETAAAAADGARALRFRPIQPRRGRINLRGTISMAADTHLIRRMEFEYFDGGDVIAQVSVDYADIAVQGHTLRFPVSGNLSARPHGVTGLLYTGITVTATMTYDKFEQVVNRR